MSDFDWLDNDEIVEQKTDAKVESVSLPAEVVRRKKKTQGRPAELIRADRKLTPAQRHYKRLLVECMTYVEAERKFLEGGYRAKRSTLWRWRQKPEFAKAFELENNYVFECAGLDKSKVLMDSEKIKQEALTPKPILYKGEHTGYKEIQLGAALRAVEFQGKALGIGSEADKKVQVNIDIDFSGRINDPAEEMPEPIEGESVTLSVE